MESELLRRFCPLVWLDSSEQCPPVDAREYVTRGIVRDVDTDVATGTLASNLSNSSSYVQLPGATPSITVAGKVLQVETKGVPLSGKVDTIHLDGAYLHSILYVMCFPPTPADRLCAHFVKVFVEATSKTVVAAAFGVEGDLPHVWTPAAELKFVDRSRERIGVFVARDDHTPLPAPGKLWRSGVNKSTPEGDGKGQSWQKDPLVLPWPTQLMQYTGRVGPDRLALNPPKRVWWDGATTDKILADARFIAK